MCSQPSFPPLYCEWYSTNGVGVEHTRHDVRSLGGYKGRNVFGRVFLVSGREGTNVNSGVANAGSKVVSSSSPPSDEWWHDYLTWIKTTQSRAMEQWVVKNAEMFVKLWCHTINVPDNHPTQA